MPGLRKRLLACSQAFLGDSVFMHAETLLAQRARPDFVEDLYSTLAAHEHPTMLLQGYAGTGKTTLAYRLYQRLYNAASQPDSKTPVPFFVSLSRIDEYAHDLMPALLASFDESERAMIQNTKQLTFIIDDVDAVGCLHNLWHSNQLSDWRVNVLFVCRTEYLYFLGEYQAYFTQIVDERMDVFPCIEYAMNEDIARLPLEDAESVLDFYSEKLAWLNLDGAESADPCVLLKNLWIRAAHCFKDNPSLSVNQFFRTLDVRSPKVQRLMSAVPFFVEAGLMKFTYPALLDALSQEMETVVTPTNAAALFPKPEVRLSKAVDSPKNTLFFTVPFMGRSTLVRCLAVGLQSDLALQETLLAVIDASKSNPDLAIAAGNAFTLFNVAGLSLHGRNFSGIHVQSGDFEGANVSSCHFDGATFVDSRFSYAFMKDAQFADAHFEQCYVAELSCGTTDTPIRSMALSPDVRWVALGHANGVLVICDRETQSELYREAMHAGRLLALEFDETSTLLALAGEHGFLRIVQLSDDGWQTAPYEFRGNATERAMAIRAVKFIPNTSMVLLSIDKLFMAWDFSDNSKRFFGDAQYPVQAIDYHDDTGLVLVLTTHSLFLFYFFDDHFLPLVSAFIPPGYIHDGCFNQDASRIAIANEDKHIYVYRFDRQSVALVLENALQGHEGPAYRCCFMGDQYLVSASSDRSVRVWDLVTNTQKQAFFGHNGFVVGVAVVPDQPIVVSAGGSSDLTWRQWHVNLDQGQLTHTRAHTNFIKCLLPIDGGRRILSGCWDGSLRVWDADTGTEQFVFEGFNYIERMTLHDNGRYIAIASLYNLLFVYDWIEQVFLYNTQPEYDIHVNYLSVVFVGDTLLAAKDTGELLFISFNVDQPHVDTVYDCGMWKIVDMFYRPDGALFFLKQSREENSKAVQVTRFDFETLTEAPCFGFEGVRSVRLQGTLFDAWPFALAVGSALMLTTLDASSTKFFKGHEHKVAAFAFSPDGQRVVTASFDKTLKVWDVHTCALLYTLTGHQMEVADVYFVNNNEIVSSSYDYVILLWKYDVDADEWFVKWRTNPAFYTQGSDFDSKAVMGFSR